MSCSGETAALIQRLEALSQSAAASSSSGGQSGPDTSAQASHPAAPGGSASVDNGELLPGGEEGLCSVEHTLCYGQGRMLVANSSVAPGTDVFSDRPFASVLLKAHRALVSSLAI